MPLLSALVVDDVALVREQLRREIASVLPDCALHECASAMDAGRFLVKQIPDVLFLDLNMPEIGGLLFLERLDKLLGGRKAPIIVSISADLSEATLAALKKRGAYDILPKPFKRGDVAELLLRVINMSRRRRALVVDDSATVRSVVRRIVERSRFQLEVTEAGSGDAALDMIRAEAFDLAFVDVEMPGIDGLEAAGEMLYSRAGVHVVLMSGRDDEAVRRAASHIGVKFFLKKPFYAGDVDAVLHTLYGLEDAAFVAGREQETFAETEFEDVRRAAAPGKLR